MSDLPRFFTCDHPGLAGTTPITIKQTPEGFEARMGFALFGYTNMDEDGFRKAQYNPFHEEFHDNFAKGTGATQEEAILSLEKDVKGTYESLW